MTVTSEAPAPYAPASAILDLVDRHRSKGLPSPINGEVLGRAGVSESLIPRTLYALQVLNLVSEDGSPTETFESLRLSPESDYPGRLANWLREAYADVLQFVDPETADEVTIRDAFRSYTPVGQQPRMVTLFISLFKAAGIGPEKAGKTRQPRKRRRPTNSLGITSKIVGMEPLQKASPVVAPHQTFAREPDKRNSGDLALEHQLVELLRNEDIGDDERNAIWTLIQYLTSKP